MRTWRITFRYPTRSGGVTFPVARTEDDARTWFKENFPTAEIKVIQLSDFSPRRKGVQP